MLPNLGEDGAGVDRLAPLPGDLGPFQDPHDRVVVVHHLPLGCLTDQLRLGRGKEARGLEQQLPLGGSWQWDPERELESLDPVHGQARSVTKQAQQSGHAVVILRLAHTSRCRSGGYLAAEVAAPALPFVDTGLERSHAGDPQQDGRLLHGIDLALGAVRAGLAASWPFERHRDPRGLGEIRSAVTPMPLRLLPWLLGPARPLFLPRLPAHRRERLGFRTKQQELQTLETDPFLVGLVPDQEHGLRHHPEVVVDLAFPHGLAELDQVLAQRLRGDLLEPQLRTLWRCRLLSLFALAHTF